MAQLAPKGFTLDQYELLKGFQPFNYIHSDRTYIIRIQDVYYVPQHGVYVKSAYPALLSNLFNVEHWLAAQATTYCAAI